MKPNRTTVEGHITKHTHTHTGSGNGWLGTATVTLPRRNVPKRLHQNGRSEDEFGWRLIGGSWSSKSTSLCWFSLSRQAIHTMFVYISGKITEGSFPDRHVGPTMVQSERTDTPQGLFLFFQFNGVKMWVVFPRLSAPPASVPSDCVCHQWTPATRVPDVLFSHQGEAVWKLPGIETFKTVVFFRS